MKIWDIIKEDFEGKKPVQEGWKENVLATVISLASLFGNAKSQGPMNTQNVSVNTQAKGDSVKLDIGRLFPSGRYIFTEKDNEMVKAELKKFGQQIMKNPTADFNVQIVSSESQVPNYDMEPSSAGYQQPLQKQQLAQKRAETVHFLMATFANQLKKTGVLKGNVNFVQPKILVGDVTWPSVDPKSGQKLTKDNPAYTKDQFVNVNISVAGTSKTAQVSDPYAAYSEMGEGIYVNDRLFGMAFFDTRKSGAIDQAGNKDTGHEDVLFKTVKPDTQLSGKRNENVYLKTYKIPSDWYNSNIHGTKMTPQQVEYITTHFEVR